MNITDSDDHPFELRMTDLVDSYPDYGDGGSCCLLSVSLSANCPAADRKHLVLVIDSVASARGGWRKIKQNLQEIIGGLRTVDLVSVIWAGKNPETLCRAGSPEEGWRAVRSVGLLPHRVVRNLKEAWLVGMALAAQHYFPGGRTRVMLVSASQERLEPDVMTSIRTLAAGFARDGIPTDVMSEGPEGKQMATESIGKVTLSTEGTSAGAELLASIAAAADGRLIQPGIEHPFARQYHDEEGELRDVALRPSSMTLGWRDVESIRGRTGFRGGVRFESLRPGDRYNVLVWCTPDRLPGPIQIRLSWTEGRRREVLAEVSPEETDPRSRRSAAAAVAAYQASLAFDRLLDDRSAPPEVKWHVSAILQMLSPFTGSDEVRRLILLSRSLLDHC